MLVMMHSLEFESGAQIKKIPNLWPIALSNWQKQFAAGVCLSSLHNHWLVASHTKQHQTECKNSRRILRMCVKRPAIHDQKKKAQTKS